MVPLEAPYPGVYIDTFIFFLRSLCKIIWMNVHYFPNAPRIAECDVKLQPTSLCVWQHVLSQDMLSTFTIAIMFESKEYRLSIWHVNSTNDTLSNDVKCNEFITFWIWPLLLKIVFSDLVKWIISKIFFPGTSWHHYYHSRYSHFILAISTFIWEVARGKIADTLTTYCHSVGAVEMTVVLGLGLRSKELSLDHKLEPQSVIQSFGERVKMAVPCLYLARHVKEPYLSTVKCLTVGRTFFNPPAHLHCMCRHIYDWNIDYCDIKQKWNNHLPIAWEGACNIKRSPLLPPIFAILIKISKFIMLVSSF